MAVNYSSQDGMWWLPRHKSF